MACTATATPEVAGEIERRLGLRDPLLVRSGFDRPNISFDTVTFEGKGSKARKLAPARARPRRCREPARDRLLRDAARQRGGRGVAARGGHAAPPPTTRAWRPTSVPPRSIASCPEDAEVIVATNAFGMGSTRPTCAPSGTGRSRPASRPTTRRPGGRGATACRPARCCSPGAPTWAAWCGSSSSASVDAAGGRRLRRTAAPRAPTPTGPGDREPPRDEERIRLAIAERAGACTVEPAPGGRLRVRLSGELDAGRAARGLPRGQGPRLARLPGGRGLQLLGTCRRRSLLDHFGDRRRGRARGPMLRRLRPARRGCPPRRRSRSGRRARGGAPPAPAPELSAEDAGLFEALKAWRLEAAAGKPAYTVAHNRTLEAIAASRPGGVGRARGRSTASGRRSSRATPTRCCGSCRAIRCS